MRLIGPALSPGGARLSVDVTCANRFESGCNFWTPQPRSCWCLTHYSVVVVYRATARRAGDAEPYRAQISAFVRQDGAWKLAFHQQTPVSESAADAS